MKFVRKLAWRNLWRNPLRSGALLISIALGVMAGLFTAALMKGILEERFDSIITSETSHLQIHHPEYRSERESKYFIADVGTLLEDLSNREEVLHFSSRTLANGLIASAATTSAVNIIGVNPESEQLLTGFDTKIVEGTYFDEPMRNPVLIGKKLFEKLNLSMGSRIVLSFQAVDGDLINAAFRVAGVYRTSNAINDEMRIYVQQADLQNIMGRAVTHEVAVLLHDYEQTDAVVNEINQKHSKNKATGWDKLSPELKYLLEQSGISTYIFMIIIMLGLGFGILNTMLMAVFERTRELGMLLALGMNKMKVFVMIIFETVSLAASGALLGIILGFLLIYWLSDIGIFMGEGMVEFGYEPMVYPVIDNVAFINVTIIVFIIAVLASVYPALKAIGLVPAEAVRK